MIKVCHMTSAHGEEDVRIFHKECVSLAKAGYDTYLVERGESREKNGVHIIGVGEIPQSRRKRMTEGAKKVYEAARAVDADIYHFHDPELLPYGLKLKRAGKKVVFDRHENYTLQLRHKPYLPTWLSCFVSVGYDVYERFALRRLDGLVIPTSTLENCAGADRCKRCAAVDNAAILSKLYKLYDPAAPKRADSVCYVGGLTEGRGITVDVLAAEKAGATLLLAGAFSSPEYQQKLECLSAYSHVDYRGVQDRAGVRALLAESMIGLSTLLDRGQYAKMLNLPIKAYEYMSMALPVIFSHSPYNDRFVERYRCGICVDPENVDEIADAIRYLLDHPDEAREMGENGRRAIKEEFNWGVEEKKLLALYEDIMKE